METLEFCINQLKDAKAANRIDSFELYFEKSSNLSVEVKDGKLDHLSRATDQGLAIRVLKNQRLGFSYTFDLSQKATQQAIRTAVELTELMPKDEYNDLSGPTALKPEQSSSLAASFDGTALHIPVEQKIELARKLEADARKMDHRVKRVRKAGYDETIAEWTLVRTDGQPHHFQETVFSADLTCVAEDGNDAQVGSESDYSCTFSKLDVNEVTRSAVESAVELLHAGQAPTMVCPAILRNSVTAQLVGFLASAFSAENIDRQSSFLIGKKGQKLFSDKLTLIDDGLLPGGVATAPFDGEGTPMQTTELVQAGTVKEFLYNNYYAKKHDTRTTAKSRRGSLKAPPGIGPTNLYLKKGVRSSKELIGSINRGILITDVMGLHTANPITGEFSFGASGILIENGKLAKPVKGFAIAGNLIALLKNVAEVGSDLRFWGSVGAPSVLVSELSIGGSGSGA